MIATKLMALSTGAILITATAGCTWVKPHKDANTVALVKPTVVQNCQKMGRTTSKVPDRVGIFARGEGKVSDELITLAKNQALTMDGDTIVSETPISGGEQSFGVYKCLR